MSTKSSRRSFLRGASSLSALSAFPVAGSYLSAMASASAASAAGDYKALVCIYLSGGNDHINTFVPYDPVSYNTYYAARQAVAGLAFSQAELLAGPKQGGKQIGFNPNLPFIKSLADANQATVVANVGPLIRPVTRDQYLQNPNGPLVPPLLASHIDQQRTWQSLGRANTVGWGGKLGDALLALNQKDAQAFTSVCGNGQTILFLTGDKSSQYVVSPQGAPKIFFTQGSGFGHALLHSTQSVNYLEQAVGGVYQHLVDSATSLNSVLEPASNFSAPPKGNALAAELLTISRIIKAAPALGAKRQIFYVNFGSFDTHDGEVSRHKALMQELDGAVAYFKVMMDSFAMWKNVTLFTMSEFGRQLYPNQDGTDHGWGSHHIVMGGAVAGGIAGALPVIGYKEGTDFLRNGWMIPTTSVEQYGVALGSWMGAADADLRAIFPNFFANNEPALKLFA